MAQNMKKSDQAADVIFIATDSAKARCPSQPLSMRHKHSPLFGR